jgi:hypothetical protein
VEKGEAKNWGALAATIEVDGDDAVDRLVGAALEGEPDPAAAPALIRALGAARSETSKRGAALALAHVAAPDDAETVEALEEAYRQGRPDASLGQALLRALGLLALRCPTARAATSSALQKLRPSNNPYLLTAAAKVIGLLCGQRDDADLRRKLGQLAGSEDPGVESEARYQLAVLAVGDAFQARTNDELAEALREARRGFVAAEELEELRPDAVMFRLLIDLVLCFDTIAAQSEFDAGKARELAASIRGVAGGLGERVFQGDRSDAGTHLAARILDTAEALEKAAGEVAEAEEWTNLHDTVVLLADAYAAIQARPARFLGQEGVEAALGAVAERVFTPRLGPVLGLRVSRKQFSRVIREHEAKRGQDNVYRGLKVLEEAALAAEREGSFQLSPENRVAMAGLIEKSGRSADELVGDMFLVFRRGDTERWTAQLGAEAEASELAPVPPWREPLWEALRVAFKYAGLERVLWMKLNVRLDEISAPGNFQDVVADVVRWAERTGRVGDLLHAALAMNPDSPHLRRVLEQYGGML